MHPLPFYMQVNDKLLPYIILGGFVLWSRSKKLQTSLMELLLDSILEPSFKMGLSNQEE